MRAVVVAICAAGGILATAGVSWAHHAFAAEFDANAPVVLKGTIARVDLINPHSWIYVDVKDATGTVTKWAIECGAPNQLLRRGWNKNSMPVGTAVVVEGFRAKNGAHKANASDIVTADGR